MKIHKMRKILPITLFAGSLLTACGEQPDKNFGSQFIGEVVPGESPQVDAPSEKPRFRWEFSEANIQHDYSYFQRLEVETRMHSFADDDMSQMKQEAVAQGRLSIKSQGDHSADLELRDVSMQMTVHWGDDESMEDEHSFPPVSLTGMKEDGSAPFAESAQTLFLQLLFPLPPGELAEGESVVIPQEMPFRVDNILVDIKGESEITLSRYVQNQDRLCAELLVSTDISWMNSEKEQQNSASLRGKSIFLFDVHNQVFVEGTLAMLMEIETNMGHRSGAGSDKDENLPRDRMTSDNLITLRLLDSESD